MLTAQNILLMTFVSNTATNTMIITLLHKSLSKLNDEQKYEGSNCLFDLLKDMYRWD
jgi:hypothetical protein